MATQTDQKSLRILFHGEGDTVKGTGHLVRSLGMAADLAAQTSWIIETANSNANLDQKIRLEWSSYGVQIPKRMSLHELPQGTWEEHQDSVLNGLLNLPGEYHCFFSDGKFPWTERQWHLLKGKFQHVFPIDNVLTLKFKVDGAIFPTDYFIQMGLPSDVPLYTGPDWVWVHPASRKVTISANPKFEFTIQMGGADPANLTLKALEDLKSKNVSLDKVLVLLGPSYPHRKTLDQWIEKSKGARPKIDFTGPGFHQKIAESKIILCAFGLIAVEAHYMKVPMVLYSHHSEHERDLQTFLKARPRAGLSRSDWLSGKSIPVLKEEIQRPNVGAALRKLIQQTVYS